MEKTFETFFLKEKKNHQTGWGVGPCLSSQMSKLGVFVFWNGESLVKGGGEARAENGPGSWGGSRTGSPTLRTWWNLESRAAIFLVS